MLNDLIDSIAKPQSYNRFALEKKTRTASYVTFLTLIFIAGFGIAVKLRLVPLFDETFLWLQTQMPTLQFSSSGVSSNSPRVRLEHPRVKEIALIVDTSRIDSVTTQMMTDEKVLAYLTSNTLYIQRGPNQIQTIDLTKGNRPFTVDAKSYQELEHAFNWVFYPGLVFFFFVMFASSIAMTALFYTVCLLIINSLTNREINFGELMRITIHAQTFSCLVYTLSFVLPKAIPYFRLISFVGSVTVLWLALKALNRNSPETAEA